MTEFSYEHCTAEGQRWRVYLTDWHWDQKRVRLYVSDDPISLSVKDIDELIEALQQAKHEIQP